MENMKSTPVGVTLFYLMLMVFISPILFHIGSGLSIVLKYLEVSFFYPLFTGDSVDEEFIGVVIDYLGLTGIIFTIAALIGYTLPITLLTIIFIFLDYLLGLSKRLASLWIFFSRGVLGRLLKIVRINTFSGDLILENRLHVKYDDIATTKGILKAFLGNAKRTLLIPASIAGLLWVFIGGDYALNFPVVFLGNIVLPGEDQNLLLYFLLIFIPIIFLFLVFPSVSVLEQTGLRTVKYSSHKEVGNITNLGESIFSLIGNVFGVSAVLLLSSRLSDDFLKVSVSAAGYSTIEDLILNIFLVLPYGLLYAISCLLILLSFFIPSACIILLYLYPTRAIESVKHVRAKLQKKSNIPVSAVVLKTFSDDSLD